MRIFTEIIFLAWLVSGCSSATRPDGEAQNAVGFSPSNDFRGVNIGDRREKVRQTEESQAVYAMPDELVYKLPLGTGDSAWYEISYNFNEEGLYDISMVVTSEYPEVLRRLYQEVCDLYLLKYGEPRKENVFTWRVMTAQARIVTIEVEDSVKALSHPAIRIHFNESGRN